MQSCPERRSFHWICFCAIALGDATLRRWSCADSARRVFLCFGGRNWWCCCANYSYSAAPVKLVCSFLDQLGYRSALTEGCDPSAWWPAEHGTQWNMQLCPGRWKYSLAARHLMTSCLFSFMTSSCDQSQWATLGAWNCAFWYGPRFNRQQWGYRPKVLGLEGLPRIASLSILIRRTLQKPSWKSWANHLDSRRCRLDGTLWDSKRTPLAAFGGKGSQLFCHIGWSCRSKVKRCIGQCHHRWPTSHTLMIVSNNSFSTGFLEKIWQKDTRFFGWRPERWPRVSYWHPI